MKPIKEVEPKKMWSKEPQRNGDYYVAGFYWRRQISTHATAMIEINQYGHIWRSEDRCVADLLSRGDYEFIGPISLSDTEELLALREAATKAEQMLAAIEHDIQQHPVPRSEVLAISEWASDGSHYNHALLNIETLNDVSAQLRKALGKE